jgi:hypothetical protein
MYRQRIRQSSSDTQTDGNTDTQHSGQGESEPNPITSGNLGFQLFASLFQFLPFGLKIGTGLVPYATALFQGGFDLLT